MRGLPAMLAVTLLSLGACACGGTSKGSATTAAPSAATTGSTSTVVGEGKDSNDLDNDAATGNDDRIVFEYGHAATPAEARTITALVKRYYATATAADGRKACPMIYSTVAEAATEDYGQSPDPAALHGKTCAVVMSKLFKKHHKALTAALPTLKVTNVLVEGDKALVILSFGTTPEPRIMPLRREGGVWKMQDLLDGGMR